MGCFYALHTSAVKVSLATASKTLKQVSPNNFFIKKWHHVKVKTKKKKPKFLEEQIRDHYPCDVEPKDEEK